ncbi:Arm DNA-binding domain-containing protein [Faucicola boevrei]|uniref:Arm DNA-binding domain-containing protein n=1 Tax=Faucicola boevrei TaxID=346665 RepID=UPI0003795D8E|nr:DUF3596 domain-containing protein [Moraxella boevrei]
MQKISTGIEPLKKSIRIWWKINGQRERETLELPPTPQNLEHAKQIAEMIKMQLTLGTFDHAKTFPNSKKRPQAYFGYYINQFLNIEQHKIAQVSFDTYKSKIEHHIRPYWQHIHIAKITTADLENWIYNILLKKLSSKTVKEILMIWRKIYRQWARNQQYINDPSQYITIKQADPDDINPFTKEEIRTILDNETDPTLKNLWTVMLWSGLSSHELMPLAVTDLDLANKSLYVRRSYVKGNYRVTKNRRRKRQIALLPNVIQALKNQQEIVKNNAPNTINITDRDNKKTKQETLTWLWYNPKTKNHFTRSQLDLRWESHLKKCKITYRPINNGRHTYASQVLSTGAVSAEWLANQLGHTNTEMIHKHYGKFIPKDSDHIINNLADKLK